MVRKRVGGLVFLVHCEDNDLITDWRIEAMILNVGDLRRTTADLPDDTTIIFTFTPKGKEQLDDVFVDSVDVDLQGPIVLFHLHEDAMTVR